MSARELGLVLVSAVLHAVWNVAAKRHSEPAAFLFLLLGATAVGTVAVLPLIPFSAFAGSAGGWLAASSVLHGLSFIALARAYEHGALSLVYPISRSTPAIVPLFAVLWLGEEVSVVGAVGIVLTLLGMWLVQTGGSIRLAALRERSALWAYVLLLLTAGFSITDKRLMTALAAQPWPSPLPSSVVAYLLPACIALLIFTPYAVARFGTRALAEAARRDTLVVIGAAIATFASYALALEALRTAPVSYVVAVRQCSVVFAVGLAVWALRERPSRGRLIGTLGTALGVALIAFYA